MLHILQPCKELLTLISKYCNIEKKKTQRSVENIAVGGLPVVLHMTRKTATPAAGKEEDMKKFLKYVVPSVLAFALSGIYAIVDGFFVGNSVGDVGLSAINVVYPVVTLMQSAGTGIGMGGAVMWTVRRAEGQKEDGDEYVRTALRLLLLTSIVLTAVMLIFMDPVLSFLGAEGTIRPLGEEYLRIMVYGTTFQVFATGIVPLIRNNGGASFAMVTMIAGFGMNIVLDYLFVWVL